MAASSQMVCLNRKSEIKIVLITFNIAYTKY